MTLLFIIPKKNDNFAARISALTYSKSNADITKKNELVRNQHKTKIQEINTYSFEEISKSI